MLFCAFQVLFFLGATDHAQRPTLQEAVRFEHERYKDIVQGNYMDSYRNLTHKATAALKYVAENCPHVPYVLKTDDDVFVNVFSLARHLYGKPTLQELSQRQGSENGCKARGHFLSCLVWYRMKVVRDPSSKWFVAEEDWEQEFFPPYCSGAAYVFSGLTAGALYNASKYTPFFWIDDLYITGILAMRLGIKHHKFTSAYQLDFSRFYAAYQTNPEEGMPLIFSHIDNFNKVGSLWNLIASRRRGIKLNSPMSDNKTVLRDSISSLPIGYAASFSET